MMRREALEMGKIQKVVAIGLFLPMALLAGEALTAPPAERKVILFNMSTERTPMVSGDWRTWQNNRHKPDNRGADGKRDISSVFYPAIGVYDVSDPDYIEYACQLISMAGVDAISFYTTLATDTWHLKTLTNWVEVMKRYGLSGMCRPQPKTPLEDYRTMMDVFEPVAFRHQGRRLLPLFGFNAKRLEDLRLWKEAFPEEDRPYLLRWLVETCKPPFDGGFDWAGDTTHPARQTTARDGWVRYFDATLAKEGYDADVDRARKLIADGFLKVYVDAVNPGFNNLAVNGWGEGNRYIERDHGNTYRYRWGRAVENGFALVGIPTWDDWGEGSGIEPTVEFGNLY